MAAGAAGKGDAQCLVVGASGLPVLPSGGAEQGDDRGVCRRGNMDGGGIVADEQDALMN